MYPPRTRNLVVADGQVSTTASAVLTGVEEAALRYNFTFTNSGTGSETLVVTFARAGGTQRQLRQVSLDPDETFELTGLPVNKTDVVYAATSNASSVDYLVSVAPENCPLTSTVYGADGLPKNFPYVFEQMALIFG